MRRKKKQKDNIFIYRLVGRVSFFLTLLTIADFLLFISGNTQQFLDATLNFIMYICSINAIILVFFSVAGIALSLFFFFISSKIKYVSSFICYIILIVFGIAIFILLRVISFLSAGI